MFSNLLGQRAALIIAHPGHELRVYGWLIKAQPYVFILADGSGHAGRSRLNTTTGILRDLGGKPGGIYGRLTDAEIYAAIIERDLDLFVALTEELAEDLVRHQTEYVVGDAMEGYNPAHDICRTITNAAVEIANQTASRRIRNFDILLTGRLNTAAEVSRGTVRIDLEDDVMARKLQAAREYLEIIDDVNRTIEREGVGALKTEVLRPVLNTDNGNGFFQQTPYYEQYGEQQVAAGYYQRVIRYRDHFLPLADGLQQYVACRGRR